MPPTPADRLVPLEGAGVVLREFRPGDADDLVTAFGDPDIARWNPGPAGPEGARGFIAERNDWSSAAHASWAVGDAEGRLVGSVSLHKIDLDQADAEIGYWVAPWARRRGIAADAVVTAVRFAVDRIGLHRVYLYHAVENAGSCAVARACGFVHEGTLRQSFRYADGRYHDEHLHGILASDLGPP